MDEKNEVPLPIRVQLRLTLDDPYLHKELGKIVALVADSTEGEIHLQKVGIGARCKIIGEQLGSLPKKRDPNLSLMIKNELPHLSDPQVQEVERLMRLVPEISFEIAKQRLIKIRDGIDPGPIGPLRPTITASSDQNNLSSPQTDDAVTITLKSTYRTIEFPELALTLVVFLATQEGWAPPPKSDKGWRGATFSSAKAKSLRETILAAARKNNEPVEGEVLDFVEFLKDGGFKIY